MGLVDMAVRDAVRSNTKSQKGTVVKTEPNVKVVHPKVQSAVITPVDLEPQEVPNIPAAKLLDLLYEVYMYWAKMEPHDAVIAALWSASTWFAEPDDGKMLFDSHPRLFMIAPPGSGKTRIMKITKAMARKPTPIVKAPVTAPGLRDALNDGRTVILDEFDRQVASGTRNMDVQSIVSAYEQDTGSLNGIGGYNAQNLFGPMILGAKPRIMSATGGWIDDLFERSFLINPVKWTDPFNPIPDLDRQFNEITENIPTVLEGWAQQVRWVEQSTGNNGNIRPIHSIPKALAAVPRNREISMALLSVADRAIDPDVVERTGQDVRWALRARDAVQHSLIGHGTEGPQIIADLAKRLKALKSEGESNGR